MPINPPPTYPKPPMSFDGIEKFIPSRSAADLPSPGRAAPASSAQGPGECRGCGAAIDPRVHECSFCKRPNGYGGLLSALIEVTALDDPEPRYVPGWSSPRPVPPPSRVVTESGRDMTGVLTVGYGISDVNSERVRRSFEQAYSRGGAVSLQGPRRPLSLLARLVRAVWPR